MNISIFDVLGPIMIGPSSSHTAGAARLGRVAMQIVQRPFDRVAFELSGSFAHTYKGHGTDRALLAGVMGLREDDARLPDAFTLAQAAGLSWSFHPVDLPDAPDNAVRISFFAGQELLGKVTGASTGGGRICIMEIDGAPAEFTAESPALVLRHADVRGMISSVSTVLSRYGVNIGLMRVGRDQRGGVATTIIETDEPISPAVADEIEALSSVLSVRAINLE